MSNVKMETQTIIGDLNEEITELSTQDLILISGGAVPVQTKQGWTEKTQEVDE